jgi:hypothetical protein
MKKKRIIVCLLFFAVVLQGWAQERNYLTKKYSRASLQQLVLTQEQFKPYPAANGNGWEQVPEDLRKLYIQAAEKQLGTTWGELKATEFMQFKRTGNRSGFETITFGRRSKLNTLVLGELFEHKGRFIDDIINGIWIICEESWWGVPAHNAHKGNSEPLPDLETPFVDLFDAETGAALAWTYYLLKDELDKISPYVTRRILSELETRILIPCMQYDDYWWMGFKGESLNNWTPWICSNWLSVMLLCDMNPERRLNGIYRAMDVIDRFLNPYPADGGCDEGPGYWDRAGGALFDCLDLLHIASGGGINIFDQPLVKNMGTYIYKANIADDYYVNFADAGATVRPAADLVYRYGKAIGDNAMKQYGIYLANKYQFGKVPSGGSYYRRLPALLAYNEIITGEGASPLLRDVWLPDLQVAIARSHDHSTGGLYIAAKGGHNAESHNHNDIGSFVVYADGKPVLIDIGVETYTAKTFSGQRYDIWTMQSAHHNLPTINGVQQAAGRKFEARQVAYSATNAKAVFSLDIAGAYPETAQVDTWKRTLTLVRGQRVEMIDAYQLKEVVKPAQWHFMTCIEPNTAETGKIVLSDGTKQVELLYDKNLQTAQVEKIGITDQRLLPIWGDRVYRITLTNNKQDLKGSCKVSIRYKK